VFDRIRTSSGEYSLLVEPARIALKIGFACHVMKYVLFLWYTPFLILRGSFFNVSKVFCGRFVNGHMVKHNEGTGHPLVLSIRDLSTWCYSCESYIDNEVLCNLLSLINRCEHKLTAVCFPFSAQVLYKAKNKLHLDKFGEALPKMQ